MSAVPGRPATKNLNDRVAALANDGLRLARAAGRADLGELLTEEARRWPRPEVSVLVAGETSRGKSSLVNVLVGRPDLLPVGPGVVSRTYVAVRSGPIDVARVIRSSRPEPVEIALDEVARWAGDDTGDVVGIEVQLATTSLPAGVTVIDTPGVGGLEEAHGRVTLAALAHADALIMVSDPSAPLSAPELDFLAHAAQRVANVTVVMSKTDQFTGWRQLLSVDRALLDARGLHDTAVVPISARLALRALRAEGALRDELWSDSGLSPINDHVHRGLAGRAQAVRMANLTRLTSTVLDAIEPPTRQQLDMYADDTSPEVREALERERQRLDDLRDATPRHQTWLSDRFALLREQLLTDATAGVKEVVERYERDLKAWRDDLDGLLRAVRSDLEVIEVRALDSFSAGSREACFQLATLIGSAASGEVFVGRVLGRIDLGSAAPSLIPARNDPMTKVRTATTIGSIATSVSFVLRTIVGGPLMAPMIVGGGAMAIGAGVSSLVLSARGRDIEQLRLQLRGLADVARTELGPALRERALVVQRAMEDELRALLRDRTRDYQNRLTEAQNAQRLDAAQRQRARAELQQRLADVSRVRQEAGDLRDALRDRLQPRAELAVTPDQPTVSDPYRRSETPMEDRNG